MLSVQPFYNTISLNNEADEIQSSSSSSSSFEHSKSFSCYNSQLFYQFQQQELIMEENLHPAATEGPTYQRSDRSTYKYSSMHHKYDYPPLPSYPNYESTSCSTTFNHGLPQPQQPQDIYQFSWPNAVTTTSTHLNHSTDGTLDDKFSQQIPRDYLLRKKEPYATSPSLPHYMSFNSLPMHHYQSNVRPNNTASPVREDSSKFHPRFKSANARLSPYSEQQQSEVVYNQFLSPPLVSNTLMGQGPLMMEDGFEERLANLQPFHQDKERTSNQASFQFDVVLHAPTAMIKKHNEQSITYLNRGQAYLIELSPISASTISITGTITSTLSIAFHDPNHRQLAENYWKYWISQQENSSEARALDLDTNQTTGVYNTRLVSFDRISFDWHARFGAKLYVRFNCLSTDFSRIKGVKGIPMRAVVETTSQYMTLPSNSLTYKGSFQKNAGTVDGYEYKEACYCKIKLFRDKGAERKNKDDKKQIAKQMEKVMASTNGNPEQHPLWPIISQSHKSTSSLTEIPSSPDITLDSLGNLSDVVVIPEQKLTSTTLPKSRRASLSLSRRMESKFIPNIDKKRKLQSSVLSFYVWAPSIQSTHRQVFLDTLTTQSLKIQLAAVLSIHPSRVSEILWRRKRRDNEEMTNDVLVLVEDTFVSEHIADGEMMTVDLELKEDDNLRLVLEFR